jgi:hypothetical protein
MKDAQTTFNVSLLTWGAWIVSNVDLINKFLQMAVLLLALVTSVFSLSVIWAKRKNGRAKNE